MMANHVAQADPNMAMMRNDENAVVHRKSLTTGSKTPTSTKSRRAFGDISNRKKAAAAQDNNKSITLGKTPVNTLKLAPTIKKAPFQTIANERSDSELQSKRRVNFTLPDATAAPKPVEPEFSDVDDIEQPAGRLWIEEQALLDAAGTDDTDISLEGVATMVEDLRAMLKQRHELKMQMEEEEFERLLTDADGPPFADLFLQDGK
jgi:hypothetical protein